MDQATPTPTTNTAHPEEARSAVSKGPTPTDDEAMLQGRIAAMARNYATCTHRYGDCSPTDLRIIGFDLDEVRQHWFMIVDQGLIVLETIRIKGCAA